MKPYDLKDVSEIFQKIGEGSAGQVFQRNQVAYKVFSMDVSLHSRQQEIGVLETFHHQNIIKLISKNENYRWFTTQLYDTDLHKLLMKAHKPFEEQFASYVIKQISSAIQYLHQQNYAHRDINSKNILISKGKQPVICDFSLATDTKKQLKTERAQGTQQYMAPELYINENKIFSSHLYKCDVYSLGVLAFETVFGEVPYNFPKLPVNQYKTKVYIEEFWAKQKYEVSNNFKVFIINTLAGSQAERWDIDEVLKSQWLNETFTEDQFYKYLDELIN